MTVSIKKAEIWDFEEIHRMILDFATFQKTPEKVSISVQEMLEDADIINALIIKEKDVSIGFATYYFGYSSWSGKHLYLDDIYIETAHRGNGLGHKIMDKLESIARSNNCKSMRWLVSNWNKSAIAFYKKRGASIDGTEFTCQLDL